MQRCMQADFSDCVILSMGKNYRSAAAAASAECSEVVITSVFAYPCRHSNVIALAPGKMRRTPERSVIGKPADSRQTRDFSASRAAN